ncbi:hypothetical protein IVB41_34555 [Bradyrhizobium sp. 44]|nr:hypothetical protein [Bradyrhizobium sp. 44]MCK1289019.1 hypothetical protein [Bradyrhizobium sp. 44]
MSRVFHSKRAREVEAADAAVMESAHHSDDVVFGNQPFIGAPERHPERHYKGDPVRLRDPKGVQVLRDRLVNRHILVLAGIGRADRDQSKHLVDFGLRGPLGAPRIRHQRAINRPAPALDALNHLFGVAQVSALP